VRVALPDPGPRFERLTDVTEWSQFEQAVALFTQEQYPAARRHFANLLQKPHTPNLTASLEAFLAESSLKEGRHEVRPIEIIEQYKTLMREDSLSTNAKRAAWRIGDVYRMEGWYQEAQVAYQHALSLSDLESYDANRAMLGLGYTLRGLGKWKDSVQVLDNVLKHTTDPGLLVSASMGQAHSLYRLGRTQEADALYGNLTGRWPAVFRKDPYALLRYADTAGEAHRPSVMRDQLLRFYNLYSNRPETPFVLAHIADSYREAGRWDEAGLFYASVLSQYPESPVAVVARLRFADVQEHRVPEEGLVNIRQTVATLVANVPLKAGETLSPRAFFEHSAKEYEDSPVGSEALFHLGETLERAGKREEALGLFEQVALRAGKFENDPWPDKSGAQLVTLLRPRIETALKANDDFELVSLFHRHGPLADRLYAGTEMLLQIADAHRRLGFPVEAARIYQSLIRDPKAERFQEVALIGLGQSYLDQKDMRAGRAVFERYRLQFPIGRFAGDALLGIMGSFEGEGNLAAMMKLGKQWLEHHPRHPDRQVVQAKLANGLATAKQYAEAASFYDVLAKGGVQLTGSDVIRQADVYSHLNRPSQALALYKQALVSGLNPEQEAWAQFQIVHLARESKRDDLVQGTLRSLSESRDGLVRRIAAVLQTDLSQPASGQRERKP
jgi:tetratricopeptide (TPR) repeat protein